MCGIADADSAEHGSETLNVVIAPVACPVPARPAGSPRLSGGSPLRIQPGSRLAAILGTTGTTEDYFCNFEVNPAYHARLQAAGMVPVAFGQQGEWRAVELTSMRFFVATLFLPQHSSSLEHPHPLLVSFVTAARAMRDARGHNEVR